MRGAIIDVRDNPGGYLESVNAIASDLLPKGAIIEQIESRNGKKIVFRASGATQQVPIVCLINHQSASAAEILAASLQESGHHPIIGGQSYGKGTVQETFALTDGSSLKLTIAKWLTPSGHSITRLGVRPDLSITTPEFAKLPPLQVESKRVITLDRVDLQIAIAQRMLQALHFSVDRTDGYFDDSTKIALKAFQRKYGLIQTGSLDTATAYQLNITLMAMRIRLDPVRLAGVGYLQKKLLSV
jgi:carboxyl-terminal processing protease